MAERLSARGSFKFGDLVGADLVNDAAKFFDVRTEPSQLFFADPVVSGISGLRVGFLQLLEHCAFAMRALRPDAVEASIKPFCERAQKGDIMVVRRVVGQREQ